MNKSIEFAVNGTITSSDCRPDMTVLEWLRGEALLRGTKEGCAEGDCGACSILVKRAGSEKYHPANSCIMLMGQLESSSIVTVEGLANLDGQGHAVQQEMAKNGSSQCGFCTPGIVAALAGMLEANPKPDEGQIHDALAGNLCRCTGYRPIVEAAEAATKNKHATLPNQELAAPKHELGKAPCEFKTPTSLKELWSLKSNHPDAVLLAGGTDLAIAVSHARARWPLAILTGYVEELRTVEETGGEIVIGGAATWEDILPTLEKHWPSFATLVRRFGSVQIRSMGTVAGNLATASPIGDGAPSLMVLNASLTLSSTHEDRTVPVAEFFEGYRKSVLKPAEIIRSIHIPLPKDGEEFRVYKISKRYDQDISTVCGAFALEMDGATVRSARIAYGGMAATPLRCRAAEKTLAGKPLSDESVAAARNAINDTFTPLSDMRGSADYRARVAANLIDRLALDLRGETVEVMSL